MNYFHQISLFFTKICKVILSIKKVIILATDEFEYNMVYIEGNLDLEEITKLAEGATHKDK